MRIALIITLALSSSACRTAYTPELSVPVSRDVQLDLSGTWNTHWGEYVAIVVLTQQGQQVSGTYSTTARPEPGVEGTLQGTITGTLEGNRLRGRWDEGPQRAGGMRWVFTIDGKSFEGAWGNGQREDDGGPWAGTR